MFFGGGGIKLFVALILWIGGLQAILQARRRVASVEEFWQGMLILLWAVVPVAITALISLLHPMFLQRYMIFSACDHPAGGLGNAGLERWHIGLLLVIALCAMSLPTIVGDYHKPREDLRSASDTILSSATPGDAVVFFPFYTRVMLDYYRDRYSGNPAAVQVFAPPYYAAGDDVRTLVKLLDANPHQFPRVWVVGFGTDSQMDSFDYGAVADEKLRSIFGAPAVRKFADIHVLEFGR